MPSYHLALLGHPLLSGPAGPVGLGGRKLQGLLLYLAAQSGSRFSRSHLAGILWENHADGEALRNLRLALHRLREALPVWPIHVSHDWLSWDTTAGVDVDLDLWRRLLLQGDLSSLAEAVALRRGPLLAGFEIPDSSGFASWVTAERRRCDEQTLAALEHLARSAMESRSWQQVSGYARQALAIDPLQESFHRHLMRSRYQAGEQAAAMAAYAACKQVLLAELGVAPDPATQALGAEISAGRLPRLPSRPAVTVPVQTEPRRPAPASPLVGRQRELAEAREILHDAHLGQGRVLLISGEAGVGKTRLLTELTGRVKGSAGTLLLGFCHQATETLPFAPVTFALRQQLSRVHLRENGLADCWQREVARLLPELGKGRPSRHRTTAAGPDQQREHLLEGIAQFLGVMDAPVTLCVEDLHWADEATLQLLAYLARRTSGPAPALVITCRCGEEGAGARDLMTALEREGLLSRIELNPLSQDDIHTLVAVRTGGENPALAARLFAQCGGNPFYATELLRALEVAGPEAGAPGAPAGLTLPRSIQAVIRQRLERLPMLARELVTAAAIMPQSADFDLLVQMTGATTAEAIPALESALAAGILKQTSPGACGISHDLIGRAVVDGLSAARLRSLHRTAFDQVLRECGANLDRIGQLGGPSLELAVQLAAHALEGQLWEPAVAWYQAAAGAAADVFAYPEASRCLERALLCLGKLTSTPDRLQVAVDIRLRLGAMRDMGLPRHVERWLAPLEAEAEALGDEDRRAATMLAQAQLLAARGRLGETVSLLELLIPLARNPRRTILLAQSLTLLGTVRTVAGEYLPSIAHLREAIPLFGGDGVRHYLYRQARSSLTWSLACLGEFEPALAEAAALLSECRSWGDPGGIALATTAMANALNARGCYEEALRLSREGMQAAQKAEHRFSEYVHTMVTGFALTHLGEIPASLEALEKAVELGRAEGIGALQDVLSLHLAEAHLAVGQMGAAEQAALHGRQLAEAGGSRGYFHRSTRILGEIRSASGRPEGARDMLAAALEGFSGLGARPEVARCHAGLAAIARSEAERDHHRRQAAEMFREMGMAADLARLVYSGM